MATNPSDILARVLECAGVRTGTTIDRKDLENMAAALEQELSRTTAKTIGQHEHTADAVQVIGPGSSVTIPVVESERMPCARCGVPVAEEFVIPNDVWNPIIRGATGERDDEFICLECWWNAVRKYIAASEINNRGVK